MATGYPDWLRAFALLGKYLEEYKVVAVDVDGKLYALLQGETVDEELRTVRLDDEGRISAFVIDSSDAWGQMLTIGNAELAARLGSLMRLDRRGQMAYQDDFGEGVGAWVLSGNGVDNAQEIVPTPYLNGGYSIKLTAGAAVGTMAQALIRTPALPSGSVGVGIWFSLGSAIDRIELNIKYYTGARVHWYAVRWDCNTELLRVLTDLAAWTQVAADVTPYYNEHFFNYLKLVFDVEEEFYTRVLLNEREPVVTACAHHSIGDDTTARVEAWVQVYSDVIGNDIIYLDSMVVTTNEPE